MERIIFTNYTSELSYTTLKNEQLGITKRRLLPLMNKILFVMFGNHFTKLYSKQYKLTAIILEIGSLRMFKPVRIGKMKRKIYLFQNFIINQFTRKY